MKKSCATVLAVLLGGAVRATSGSAAALTCGGNSVTSPQDGATNMPTNTLLWATAPPAPRASWGRAEK